MMRKILMRLCGVSEKDLDKFCKGVVNRSYTEFDTPNKEKEKEKQEIIDYENTQWFIDKRKGGK